MTAHDYIIDIVHHRNVLIKMHIFRWRWLSLLQRRGGVECPFVVRPCPDQPAQWKKQVPVGLAIQAESSQHLSECMIKKPVPTLTLIQSLQTTLFYFFPFKNVFLTYLNSCHAITEKGDGLFPDIGAGVQVMGNGYMYPWFYIYRIGGMRTC